MIDLLELLNIKTTHISFVILIRHIRQCCMITTMCPSFLQSDLQKLRISTITLFCNNSNYNAYELRIGFRRNVDILKLR